MRATLYVTACLVLPALWGLLVSFLYDRLSERRPQRHNNGEDTAEMYHI